MESDTSTARNTIFLDVDGVISPFGGGNFEHHCMENLKLIVIRTNAQIVLSSTWRTSDRTTEMVNKELVKRGLMPCVSKTPNFDGPSGRTRVDEILSWLENNEGKVANWIAIDDIDLAWNCKDMKGHFVHCVSSVGLTGASVTEAIKLLTSSQK